MPQSTIHSILCDLAEISQSYRFDEQELAAAGWSPEFVNSLQLIHLRMQQQVTDDNLRDGQAS